MTKLSREAFDSANYVIKGCAGQTVQVIFLLQQTIRGVRKAIEAIDNADPPGTTVYNKFFDGVDPNKIKGILSKMAAGPSVYLQGVLHKPLITCVRPDVAKLASTWAFCQQEEPAISAIFVSHTSWISLCPRVFTEPEAPSPEHCVGQPSQYGYSNGHLLAST